MHATRDFVKLLKVHGCGRSCSSIFLALLCNVLLFFGYVVSDGRMSVNDKLCPEESGREEP
jgi:hypothetical protein